jgi:glycosyl hydrolase family 48
LGGRTAGTTRFDDLIVRAASTDPRPVKQQISRGRAYWFWATSADITQVETKPDHALTVTLGPIATPVEHPLPAPEDDNDDEACRYGEDTFTTWNSKDRESDAIIPVQRTQPPASRIVLDWSNPAHVLPYQKPCRLCGSLTLLADERGLPCHKVCAENVRSQQRWSSATQAGTGPALGAEGAHVRDYSQDVGVTAALVKTLLYYAAGAGDTAAQTLGKNLLDALSVHTTDKGIAVAETRTDYKRFEDPVYIPSDWTGTMPNGGPINAGSTFLSIRSFYEDDPDLPKVQAYLDGGAAPSFTYHRFRAQADIAMALAVYSELFGTAS